MSVCPVCNTPNPTVLLRWKQYHINRCHHCALTFATPLPSEDELTAFYQGFMFNKPEPYEIQRKLSQRKKEFDRLFSFVPTEARADKTFLDFGAGTGTMYQAARELGMTCYYQDLDEQAKAFTKNQFGLTDAYIIEDIDQHEGTFDLIFSDNVIEHVPDPLRFVEALMDHLSPGGSLVIKTPHSANTETLLNPVIALQGYLRMALSYNSPGKALRGWFKRFWHCDPPRHIYSFSAASFRELMASSRYPTARFDISYYQTPWFSNTYTRQFFTKDRHLTLLKSILVRIALLPIVPIEVLLQTLKWLLIKIRVVSPGGIILTVHR